MIRAILRQSRLDLLLATLRKLCSGNWNTAGHPRRICRIAAFTFMKHEDVGQRRIWLTLRECVVEFDLVLVHALSAWPPDRRASFGRLRLWASTAAQLVSDRDRHRLRDGCQGGGLRARSKGCRGIAAAGYRQQSNCRSEQCDISRHNCHPIELIAKNIESCESMPSWPCYSSRSKAPQFQCCISSRILC